MHKNGYISYVDFLKMSIIQSLITPAMINIFRGYSTKFLRYKRIFELNSCSLNKTQLKGILGQPGFAFGGFHFLIKLNF